MQSLSKKEFYDLLIKSGFSPMTIKFYRTNRSKPYKQKQEEMERDLNIPIEAWRNMQFWLKDGAKCDQVCKNCQKYNNFFKKEIK